MEQPNNVSADRYERQRQKKAIRAAEASRARRERILKKFGYWIAGLAVMIGGGWLLITVTGLGIKTGGQKMLMFPGFIRDNHYEKLS